MSNSLSNIQHHFLRESDHLAPVWVEQDRHSLEPRLSWRHYVQQHDQGKITCRDAERWLESGSTVGFLPRNGIYAVHFRTDEHMHSIRAVEIALCRGGADLTAPPMVSALGGGSTALFRLPLEMEGLPMRNLIRGIHVDGIDGMADLILGPRAVIHLMGPFGDPRGMQPCEDWITPPFLDPRAWVNGDKILRPSAARDDQRGQHSLIKYEALEHLQILSSRWRGSDQADDHFLVAAADLVVEFQFDPFEARQLMTAPIDLHDPSSDSFISRIAKLRGGSVFQSPQWLLECLEDAVDGRSNLEEERRLQQAAVGKLKQFGDMLSCLPPVPLSYLMMAEDLRHWFFREFDVNPDHINDKVFGSAMTKMMRFNKNGIRRERIPGSYERAYRGISIEALFIAQSKWSFMNLNRQRAA